MLLQNIYTYNKTLLQNYLHNIIGLRPGNTGLQNLTKHLMNDVRQMFSDIYCDLKF